MKLFYRKTFNLLDSIRSLLDQYFVIWLVLLTVIIGWLVVKLPRGEYQVLPKYDTSSSHEYQGQMFGFKYPPEVSVTEVEPDRVIQAFYQTDNDIYQYDFEVMPSDGLTAQYAAEQAYVLQGAGTPEAGIPPYQFKTATGLMGWGARSFTQTMEFGILSDHAFFEKNGELLHVKYEEHRGSNFVLTPGYDAGKKMFEQLVSSIKM